MSYDEERPSSQSQRDYTLTFFLQSNKNIIGSTQPPHKPRLAWQSVSGCGGAKRGCVQWSESPNNHRNASG